MWLLKGKDWTHTSTVIFFGRAHAGPIPFKFNRLPKPNRGSNESLIEAQPNPTWKGEALWWGRMKTRKPLRVDEWKGFFHLIVRTQARACQTSENTERSQSPSQYLIRPEHLDRAEPDKKKTEASKRAEPRKTGCVRGLPAHVIILHWDEQCGFSLPLFWFWGMIISWNAHIQDTFRFLGPLFFPSLVHTILGGKRKYIELFNQMA